MTTWTLRTPPDHYLVQWPNGPHSHLARQLVANRVQAYERELLPALPAASDAFVVLVRLLGLSLFAKDGQAIRPAAVHQAAKQWLDEALPRIDLDAFHATYPLLRKERTMALRRIVQRVGLNLSEFGTLGVPARITLRPRFWKFRTPPIRYVSRYEFRESRADRQKLLLAKAAIAPFEQQMDREWRVVEKELLSLLAKHGCAAEGVVAKGLDRAHLHIVYGRYEGIHSHDHYQRMKHEREAALAHAREATLTN